MNATTATYAATTCTAANPYESPRVPSSHRIPGAPWTCSVTAAALISTILFATGLLIGYWMGYDKAVYDYYTGPKIRRVETD
jgi:hypothetical protein